LSTTGIPFADRSWTIIFPKTVPSVSIFEPIVTGLDAFCADSEEAIDRIQEATRRTNFPFMAHLLSPAGAALPELERRQWKCTIGRKPRKGESERAVETKE
jgi:hypothetical protein